MMTIETPGTMWSGLRHAGHVPILLSYTSTDALWAQWIVRSLQAAGHTVDMVPAGVDFADRIAAASSGPDPVILLVSREHRATESQWARLPRTPRLVVFLLDSATPPAPLRATNWKSLFELDEEEALEVLMAAVGGPQNPFSRTP